LQLALSPPAFASGVGFEDEGTSSVHFASQVEVPTQATNCSMPAGSATAQLP
jgi:hypothetical protein